MSLNSNVFVMTLASLAIAAGLGIAQDQPPSPGQPLQPPPPGEGRGGRPLFDPQQFVDRLLGNDADGDGKLAREELPENLRERLFAAADSNGDGFLDKEELTTYASTRRPGGPQQGEGFGQQAPSFHQSMEVAGRGFRGLRNSALDVSTTDRDLMAVQAVQAGLLGAKAQCSTVPMSAAAMQKFGMDEAAFRRELRKQLVSAIAESLVLETAILDGDPAEAKAALTRLHDAEESAHDLFQPME